jgi:glycosyltransferase involved in cell wall biosynthesis
MHLTYVTETHPPEINGVALTVARAIAFLRGRGHHVDVIRPAQPHEARGSGVREWRSTGLPIPMYRDMRFGLARPAQLAERFVRTGTRLVHVATEGPLGWAALAAARRLGLPTTSDFRTNFHQYSRYYGLRWLESPIRSYLRRFHNGAGRTFAPTARTRQELIDAGFERVEVVGRGVDLERFSPARRDRSLRLSWTADDGPVLLYVGRLAAEKRVELALNAFQSARRFDARARMIVVGDGPRRAALEREFPAVRFIGTQTGDALAACYASADLFVFPSESETFGNVTLEALASGLPVIAFDSGAASEYVVDRLNGRLVAPGDDAAFVIAVCLMTSLQRSPHHQSRAARESVAGQGWDKALRSLERQLLEAVGDGQPARSDTACAA